MKKSKSKKELLFYPIVATVVGGVILALYEAIPFRKWVSKIFSAAYDFFEVILMFRPNLAVWQFLILITLLAVCIWIIRRRRRNKVVVVDPIKLADDEWNAKFSAYTEDYFEGFRYSWSWRQTSRGTFDIVNIYALCKRCEGVLLNDKCSKCRTDYGFHATLNDDSVRDRIDVQIENMRREHFRK